MTDAGDTIGLQRGVSEIVCTDCETSPRLKSLDKNPGTQTMCDCDDVKKSMDSVPYELEVGDLPDSWVVVEGRTPRQMSTEVDAMMATNEWECPNCETEYALAENVSCNTCGYIPEAHRA